jgi:hypothetical protein
MSETSNLQAAHEPNFIHCEICWAGLIATMLGRNSSIAVRYLIPEN